MNKMFDIAKEKDNGIFAKYGMREYCSGWFGVGNSTAKSVNYIVDTYLECIDGIDFDTWIGGCCYPTRPMIFTRIDLESFFSDLLVVSKDLEVIVDLFMYLYNQEFWIDELNDCIYTCEYDDKIMSRHRLDFIGIAMEFERLCTKHELEMLEWKDIDSFIECMDMYGYDIKKDYDYLDDDIYTTANNIEERLEQIFRL